MRSTAFFQTAVFLPFLWTSTTTAQFLTQTSSLPLLQTSTAPSTSQPSSGTGSNIACNNSPSLCSKPYSNITHLGAHNSPFIRNASTSFSTAGNHGYSTTIQLSAGVRLLSGQVHSGNSSSGTPEWHMCHSLCSLMDAGTVTSWLEEVRRWMDSNPNEVVTLLLVNSDRASTEDLGAAFEASGIAQYAYTPSGNPGVPPTTWPTLQSMISDNKRLVTFVAPLVEPSSQFPYLLDEFSYVFENNFENTNPTNYSCQPHRPSSLENQPQSAVASNRLFLMNHFLYEQQLFGIETPNSTYIQTTNGGRGLGSLGERLRTCNDFYGKEPTFVLVDFFNSGPAIASVDRVNGVSGAVGRTSLPVASVEAVETGGVAGRKMGRGGSLVAVVVALGVVAGGFL